MQTRKPGLRALTLAVAGVLTLGLAACEETKTVDPVVPTEIEVSPSGTIDLQVGDQITVVANVANATAGSTVTWTTSNSAVATVSGGNVTAVGPGIATITATAPARQGGTVSDAMAVRVGGTDLPNDSAQVVIEGLVDDENNPIDTDDVEGTVFVRLDVTRGAADSLHVMLGDEIVCRQNFTLSATRLDGSQGSASLAQAEFVCPINTLATDSADAPRFANGPTTLTARLIDDGEIVATASRSITLGNQSDVVGDIEADTTAIGDTGLRWYGGDVMVDVSPVVFAGGTSVSRVTVTAVTLDADGDVDDEIASITDTEAPFSVTFEADDDLGEETYPRLAFMIASTTAAGGEGPESMTAAIRYDNEAPAVVAADVDDIEWINERAFSEFVDEDAEDADTGVGGVELNFFAIDADDAGDADEIMEEGEEVETGSDLDETNTSTSYALVTQACDALGNCVTVEEDEFGVDTGDPVIDDFDLNGGTGDDGEINPTDIDVSIEDERSGPADQPLFVTAIGMNAEDSEFCAIGDEDDDCAATDETDVDFSVLDDEDAYYTVTVQAVDQAGNLSEPETVTFLLDATAPEVEDLDFSATIEPGDEAEFETAASDNVDLASVAIGFSFGAGAPYDEIVAASEDVGDFGAPLTEEEELTVTTTYIGALSVNGGAFSTVTDIFGRATDVAGNVGDLAVPAVNTAAADEDLPASFGSFVIESVDGDASDPVEVEGSVTVRAVLDINDPEAETVFERVNFYIYEDVPGGEVTFIGSDESASQSTTAGDRTFAFTVNLNSMDFEDGTTYNVFAVGIESDGDAIATEEFEVDIVNDEDN